MLECVLWFFEGNTISKLGNTNVKHFCANRYKKMFCKWQRELVKKVAILLININNRMKVQDVFVRYLISLTPVRSCFVLFFPDGLDEYEGEDHVDYLQHN